MNWMGMMVGLMEEVPKVVEEVGKKEKKVCKMLSRK